MSVSERTKLDYAELTAKQIPAIMSIEVEAYPEPWTVGMFREEVRSPRSRFFVSTRRGQLIGYAGFWLILDEAHITSVTVAKKYRGKGYGRDQVLHLLSVGEELGVKTYTLEVRESNATARRLYESLGFEVAGRRKQYYSSTREDALIMSKSVD